MPPQIIQLSPEGALHVAASIIEQHGERIASLLLAANAQRAINNTPVNGAQNPAASPDIRFPLQDAEQIADALKWVRMAVVDRRLEFN